MSLRARLLLVLAALAVAGLVAADFTTYYSLRSSLVARVDRTVEASTHALGRTLRRTGRFDPGALEQLAASNPGVYLGVIDATGQVRWIPISVRPGETPPPPPRLPEKVPAGVGEPGTTFTVGATRGSTEFRARAEPLPASYTLVVAAPLTEVADTLDRLFLIELFVTLGVVAAIVALGYWLVRVGLWPLRRIEETAGAIAAGDLAQRVPDTNERTEVGRLGVALNTMLAQIEQAFAERLASEERLRRFVGDASHELRTPLASVQAYAELFERGARDRPADLARAMAGIEREAKRMGILVDDLLLLARLDQGRPLERKAVDLTEVVGEAVDAARMLEPGRPIDLVTPGPLVVTGDRARLRQVVDNLLANVRAHTPPATAAAVRLAREQETAVVEVADEGPGLGAEQAARVFERFYRADPSRSKDRGGSGLGLTIVAAIAAAHGGDASVLSAPGEGTTFRVSLPLDGPDSRPPDDAGS